MAQAVMESLGRNFIENDFAGSICQNLAWLRAARCKDEFKRSGSGVNSHAFGKSPPHVFPLPPVGLKRDALSGSASWDDRASFWGGNVMVAALNWLHGGQQAFTTMVPTAAHGRVHSRLEGALRALVMNDEPTLGPERLDSFLRQTQHYTGTGVVLALGARGGVPDKAADVALADELAPHFPDLARQVTSPSCLLLPAKKRPRKVRKGYTWVSSTYPELVRKNVKAGLQKLKQEHQVAKHGGRLLLAGAFAVVKDDKEDRVITDPSVNQLLNEDSLPRPRFAYIPSLRSVTVPSSGVIKITKRDARHYFHRLRIGRRWGRWLCSPPISLPSQSGPRNRKWYPAAQATPMGFGPSAGWAQALTDAVAIEAGLPQEHRLHPDFTVPEELPIWGSIIDDIWAIEHGDEAAASGVGVDWMNRAEEAWTVKGVEPNHKKSVNEALGEEIQGYFVHPRDHWIGVSLEKRRHLYQATMCTLMRKKVLVGVVDRLIGKHSFIHSCRPAMRSIFEATYAWITTVRGRRRELVVLPSAVWVELCISASLLPLAHFSLSSKWSQRVECTDASMTGLGRAYGWAPTTVVQTLARYSEHRNIYTNLKLPWSVGLTKSHACPLRRVRVPIEKIKWHYISSPWQCLHITLGEADAITWAAEDRLRRLGDDGARFVHPVDSAACAGSFSKGRSSSRQLNKRCRTVCAINLAGGHEVWYPWMPSEENPADGPSREFEPSGKTSPGQVEQPPTERPDVDLREVGLWPRDVVFFLHLCSGPRREGDLLDAVARLGAEHGIDIQCVAIDPLADISIVQEVRGVRKPSCAHPSLLHPPGLHGDLLSGVWGDWILKLIASERVAGSFASPPCCTVSAARHQPLKPDKLNSETLGRQGPRPLRSRAEPWIPLDYCNPRERHAVHIGSALFLICLGLLGEVARRGGWAGLEHQPTEEKNPFHLSLQLRRSRFFAEHLG